MRLERRNGVRRNHIAALVAVPAVAVSLASSAEAKFPITLAVEPARPVAGQQARMIIRTGIVLPRKHGIEVHAVGPWREGLGQGFFDVRLVRVGPRTLRANVRFPYAGRWSLVVASGAPPTAGRLVNVRPRA
jgi:hypothetical protein